MLRSKIESSIFPTLFLYASPLAIVEAVGLVIEAIFDQELDWMQILKQLQEFTPSDQLEFFPFVLTRPLEASIETCMKEETMSAVFLGSPDILLEFFASFADANYPITLVETNVGFRFTVPEVLMKILMQNFKSNGLLTVPELIEDQESLMYPVESVQDYTQFSEMQELWQDFSPNDLSQSFFWISQAEYSPGFQPESFFQREVRYILHLQDEGQLGRVLTS